MTPDRQEQAQGQIDNSIIDDIFKNVRQIPTLPNVIAHVMSVMNNPESSASDVAKLISHDPALASKILRLANSAFYGRPRTVSSVNHAVVTLGFNTVRALMISASVILLFPGDTVSSLFDRRSFWKHCLACAIAARYIVKQSPPLRLIDAESAFCAGLLHDLGKIIFDQFLHNDFIMALEKAHKEEKHSVFVEQEVLGITHARAGAALAEKWNLPADLRYPMEAHHAPETAEMADEYASVVHVADYLCWRLGMVSSTEKGAAPPFNQAVAQSLSLDEESLTTLQDEIEREIGQSGDLMNIIES